MIACILGLFVWVEMKYTRAVMAFMMTQGFGKLNFRVEVITLEAKAQSLKYLPLGFRLRLESEIINGTPQPLG